MAGIQLFKANFDVEACLAQVRECLEKVGQEWDLRRLN